MEGDRIGTCDITGAIPIELRFKHEAVVALGYRVCNLQDILASRDSLNDTVERYFEEIMKDGYRGKSGIHLSSSETHEGEVDNIKRHCLDCTCIEELDRVTFSDIPEQQSIRMRIASEAFNEDFMKHIKIVNKAIDAEIIAEEGESYINKAGVVYLDELIEGKKQENTGKIGIELMRVIERRQDMLVALFEHDKLQNGGSHS